MRAAQQVHIGNRRGLPAFAPVIRLGLVILGEKLGALIGLRLAVGGVSTHHPLLRVESRICERLQHPAPGRRLNGEMVTAQKRIRNRVSSQAPNKKPTIICGAT